MAVAPVNLRLAAESEPEASITPPWLPTEKRRSVDWALAPVYCSVPPSSESSVLAPLTEPLPMEEAVLMFANWATFSNAPFWVTVRPV